MRYDITSAPDYWKEACASLSEKDEVMAGLIKRYRKSHLPGSKDAFITLCRAICGQQISVQAADTIWAKFYRVCKPITPERISRKHISTLQKCGLSNQKANYIKHLARFFVKENITSYYWKNTDENEVYESLIEVKGVGKWTIEMFSIFYLRSPDILPLGDLGLVKAIAKEYQYEGQLRKDEIEALAKIWQPWRTVATWYLWRSIDPEPIVY